MEAKPWFRCHRSQERRTNASAVPEPRLNDRGLVRRSSIRPLTFASQKIDTPEAIRSQGVTGSSGWFSGQSGPPRARTDQLLLQPLRLHDVLRPQGRVILLHRLNVAGTGPIRDAGSAFPSSAPWPVRWSDLQPARAATLRFGGGPKTAGRRRPPKRSPPHFIPGI